MLTDYTDHEKKLEALRKKIKNIDQLLANVKQIAEPFQATEINGLPMKIAICALWNVLQYTSIRAVSYADHEISSEVVKRAIPIGNSVAYYNEKTIISLTFHITDCGTIVNPEFVEYSTLMGAPCSIPNPK